MNLQQFGKIEIGGVESQAMLSIDGDCLQEGMLHWWTNPGEPAGALLLAITYVDDSTVSFSVHKVGRVADNGSVSIPSHLMPNEIPLRGLTATLKRDGNVWRGQYHYASGLLGGTLELETAEPHKLKAADCEDWSTFKNWCTQCSRDGFTMFRGHGDAQFSLQTTMHRHRRHRMGRFWNQDLFQFRLQIEAATGHKLSLTDADDAAQLLALGQHHGMPTPMLDLSASPYVAAFFAFSDALENAGRAASHVRVYAFTQKYYNDSGTPIVTLDWVSPFVSSLGTSARINPRLLAQQGTFLISNVADMETFICRQNDGTHLIAVDLPVALMVEAMSDLRLMNITAATLFPGIDGICKMIKHDMLLQNLKAQGHGLKLKPPNQVAVDEHL